MNSKFLIYIHFTLLIFMISIDSFSQGKKISPGKTEVNFTNEINSDIIGDGFIPNAQIADLETQMMNAKRAGDAASVTRIREQLDRLTGTVSNSGEKMELTLIDDKFFDNEMDNINNGFVSSVTGVKGIATCTEAVGLTGSRIWTIFVFGPNSGPTNDMLRLCYSDDGGRSWNHKVTLGFSTGNRMWADEIDVELIEDYTGDKYIYTCFGYATNNYAGLYRVGMTIVKITGALDYYGTSLVWPGMVNSNFYYRPRITSDNQQYLSNPWIYITCVFDSAVVGGYRSGEKVAIVYSPYTTIPTFTYKPTSFRGLTLIYPSDFFCDIAYYRNAGSDSIVMVESSLIDSSNILITKSSISSYVSSSVIVGSFNVTPARRYQAYVASNGAFNGLMIVNMRKYDPFDWDIEFFVSSNGAYNWGTGYVDFRGNNSTRADIQGFRNAPGTFSCAYSENSTPFVPVSYCYATNYVWGPIVPQMNHVNTNPFIAKPRPGVRYGPEDESCFAVWTEYSGGTNVWAAVGCSGQVNSYKNIFFRGVIEGLWDAPADTMRNDTVTLLLREDSAPYNIVDSSKVRLDNDGYGSFWFTDAQEFTNYYIVVKHRNAIETWSATTFQFSPGVPYTYDFTFSPLQAYGVNMVQVDVFPDLFAFYSGDVNQDGIIEGGDLALIDNDASNFITGYVPTDINGDEFVDGSDAAIADNNAFNFVSVIRP